MTLINFSKFLKTKKITNNPILFIFFFLVLLHIGFSILSPHFFTAHNLREITVQSAVLSMIAAGQTFVILSAGIDLGAGSVLAVTSVTTAMVMAQTNSTFIGMVVGLMVGALCGWINGIIIGCLRIPPFVATLGMQGMARGVALLITGGVPQYQLAEGAGFLGQGRIFGLPVSTLTVIFLYIFCALILKWTRKGRYTYAVGSNAEASFLSGINIPRQHMWIYMISGLTAGLAGLTELSRIGSGQPGAGMGYELDSIAAVVLGGTSLQGGIGSIWGSLIGALIIVSLRNGLNVMNINAYWQHIVIGAIIILAVYTDQVRNSIRK